MKDYSKLKEFLNLSLDEDFNTNPKMLIFYQRKQKMKELEQTLIERKNKLDKVKEKLAITKII